MPKQPELTPPVKWAFAHRLLAALAWTGAGLGTGYALRFLAIEPEAIGRACLAESAPWGCVLRQGLISLFHFGILGGVAAAVGLYVLWRRHWRKTAPEPATLRAALIMGGLALALYNAGLGSVAVVLGLLAAMEPGRE